MIINGVILYSCLTTGKTNWVNQWKNTKAVLAWFTGIQHKELHSFIALDVVEFYPSISIDLLAAALEFASKHVTICDDERHIILQAKSSLLYNSGKPWSKRTSSNLFDVTVGSYDGAESCELVGTYLLHNIKERFGNACVGRPSLLRRNCIVFSPSTVWRLLSRPIRK